MRARALACLGLTALLFAAAPAGAAVLTVNSFDDRVDANPGDGVCASSAGTCTLRAAVQTANALAGADAIVLKAGRYVLTVGSTREDAAVSGDLDVAGGGLEITGPGAALTVIEGPALDRVVHVLPGAGLTLTGVTLTKGHALDGFGGGGILNQGSAALTGVAVTASTTTTGGAGIMNTGGSLSVTSSTLSGNGASSHGGGVWNFGGQASLTNVTLSGNRAGPTGGAVRNDGLAAAISLVHVTVAGNSSTQVPSAVANGGAASGIVLKSSVLLGAPGEACAGPVTSAGFNVEAGGSCRLSGPGDKALVDPLLGPLADNGGPLQTHALLVGSPAIDAADPASCPGIDERGVARPQGAACDAGAFEYTAPRSFARRVTLALAEHLLARGRITAAAGAPALCLSARVTVQRRVGSAWRNAGSAAVSVAGTYEVKLRDRAGVYRALVGAAPAGQDTCLAATSRTKRHRHPAGA